MSITLILLFAGLVLFVCAAIPLPSRFGLLPAGLACWILAEILARGLVHV